MHHSEGKSETMHHSEGTNDSRVTILSFEFYNKKKKKKKKYIGKQDNITCASKLQF